MANHIITIGRQCGSGGHTIGKLLAQRLGLAFYDKKIVEMVAAKTKLSPDFIRSHGEYFHGGSLGHIIGYGTRFDSSLKTGSSLTDQLHQVQSEIILEVAEKEPCVIVGRCDVLDGVELGQINLRLQRLATPEGAAYMHCSHYYGGYDSFFALLVEFLEDAFVESALAGCRGEQLLVVALYAQLFGEGLAHLLAAAAELSPDGYYEVVVHGFIAMRLIVSHVVAAPVRRGMYKFN